MKAPGVFTWNADASKKGTYPFWGPPEAIANPNPHDKFCLGISS